MVRISRNVPELHHFTAVSSTKPNLYHLSVLISVSLISHLKSLFPCFLLVADVLITCYHAVPKVAKLETDLLISGGNGVKPYTKQAR